MPMSTDAVSTLVSYLEREWGYGRTMDQVVPGPFYGSALAQCSASDGSEWWIGTDRYGEHKVHADTREECTALLLEAHGAREQAQQLREATAAKTQTQAVESQTATRYFAAEGWTHTEADGWTYSTRSIPLDTQPA